MCPVAHYPALDLKLLTQCWTLSPCHLLHPFILSFFFSKCILSLTEKKIKASKIQNLGKCLILSGYSRVAKCLILSGCSKVCKQKFFILKTLTTFIFSPSHPLQYIQLPSPKSSEQDQIFPLLEIFPEGISARLKFCQN